MTPGYLTAVRGVLDYLERTQLTAIESAADLVVHALTHNGAVFCSGIGHSNQNDFLNRAGGLAALQAFTFGFSLHDPVAESLKNRPREDDFNRELETVRLAIRASNLRPGDVMVIGSVSGKNSQPIEIAMACRDHGVKVIGLTSMEYTAQVESLHPSGKKLFEAVDVVIDNGAPFGDGAVEIPGYDFKLCPVSGVANIVSGWLIWERAIEKMVEAGNPPSVFMSLNRPGGKEYYDESVAQYQKRGY